MSDRTTFFRSLLGSAAIALVVVGCGSPAVSPSPAASAPPAPSATPGVSPGVTPGVTLTPTPGAIEVTSPAQAAALVIASDPRFARVGPLLPNVVGQSAWYEASDLGPKFSVAITLGSGDCQSGCIDRHTWHFIVGRDGTITLDSEEGDDVEVPGNHGSGPATVDILLSAGPICPVVQDPPDPNCADRAVANAEVILRDARGTEVARGMTDADGQLRFSVPAGIYYAEPAPVEGMMGQAEAVAFGAIGGESVFLSLSYDTGIR